MLAAIAHYRNATNTMPEHDCLAMEQERQEMLDKIKHLLVIDHETSHQKMQLLIQAEEQMNRILEVAAQELRAYHTSVCNVSPSV